MESVRENALMAEAIPRLAVSMKSVLADAQIQVLEKNSIEIRFDGLPAWQIKVSRNLVNNQYQMFVTHVDLKPLCLASMSNSELQRLAAIENLGLRGVTVLPINPEMNDGRGGLRIRTAFIGQKGRSTDEVENLTVDIMSVVSFARTLEDRLTDSTVAGEFSFELYNARTLPPSATPSSNGETLRPDVARNQIPPARFVSNGQALFQGSTDRVFGEITKSLKMDLGFQVRVAGDRTALIVSPEKTQSPPLEIVVRIPEKIPVFVAHAPLLKLSGMAPADMWSLLDELNAYGETGHFEINPADGILCFTSWKHLTNDLRHFSFDHTVLSVNRAYALAIENLQLAPVQSGGGIVLAFPVPSGTPAARIKNAA